jgi:hypothetical protein
VITSLESINQLIFVMVMGTVLSEVWTEFLSIIYMNLGFKGLNEATTTSAHTVYILQSSFHFTFQILLAEKKI